MDFKWKLQNERRIRNGTGARGYIRHNGQISLILLTVIQNCFKDSSTEHNIGIKNISQPKKQAVGLCCVPIWWWGDVSESYICKIGTNCPIYGGMQQCNNNKQLFFHVESEKSFKSSNLDSWTDVLCQLANFQSGHSLIWQWLKTMVGIIEVGMAQTCVESVEHLACFLKHLAEHGGTELQFITLGL